MPEDRLPNDPSRHPLSDPYENDPTGVPVESDTIRILRGDFIHYVVDTRRGMPLWWQGSGLGEELVIGLLYATLLSLIRSPVKVGLLRVRRDWTGKGEILHREVLARDSDPEAVKTALAARVRDGQFDGA
ncbi:MAG: hypothetical protein ABWX60_08740 [Aeromicrobium sp.]